MNDKEFYLLLTKTFEEVKEIVLNSGGKEVPHITIWLYDSSPPEIVISSGYSTNEIKVTGKELSVLTDEYLHRLGFNNQQKVLAIAAPVVENEVIEPQNFSEILEDEVPF
jgi:hypothetical protein